MRTEGDFIKINKWLTPLSWIYGAVVNLRNQLYEVGFFKSRSFDIPVISVGNITVGGSGKTPHVEYLIRLLQDEMKVAVLSRGYKRKSKGYVLAERDEDKHVTTSMQRLGDEPYQMAKKFENTYIAVDKNRCDGIDRLTHDEATSDTDVILLDDAFQHRAVKPGINILLVDYHRLILYDKLLPAGRLREPVKGKLRADIVIVTKCPADLNPMEFRVLTKAMNLFPYQDLFFTTLDYGAPIAVFPEGKDHTPEELFSGKKKEKTPMQVLLVTGIASPRQLETDMKSRGITPQTMTFPDHHFFTDKDVQRINDTYAALPSPKIIITTEKDQARIENLKGLSEEVRASIYALPIEIKFMLNEEEKFNNKIIDYVRKNSRNSILVKRKDDNKARDSRSTRNGFGTISFRDN